MTSIQSGMPIDLTAIKQLDLSKAKITPISEVSEDRYQSFVSSMERVLEGLHAVMPTTEGHPAYETYAHVEVNGKTVATLDNNGFTESSSGAIHKLLAEEDSALRGPALAQERADKIAEELGGKVVKSSSALTQAEFNAAPQLSLGVNYNTLKADPAYEQLQKTKQARTLFLAQQIGQDLEAQDSVRASIGNQDNVQSDSAAAAAAAVYTQAPAQQDAVTEERSEAVSDFLDYMSKTPEERFRAALLAEEGLTEEEFAALPAKQKIEIEEKIRAKIEDSVEESVGENLAVDSQSSIIAV
tara:strand:- start:666920 stop:667816 length:897 start_codon:yes stop_codon:yes gene_type:complete